jgi:transcriptional regulator with XRE-family HTH domain
MVTRRPALSVASFTDFGTLLRVLRRRAGLTQRQLGLAVGYSEAQICRLEQRVDPRRNLLLALSPAGAVTDR